MVKRNQEEEEKKGGKSNTAGAARNAIRAIEGKVKVKKTSTIRDFFQQIEGEGSTQARSSLGFKRGGSTRAASQFIVTLRKVTNTERRAGGADRTKVRSGQWGGASGKFYTLKVNVKKGGSVQDIQRAIRKVMREKGGDQYKDEDEEWDIDDKFDIYGISKLMGGADALDDIDDEVQGYHTFQNTVLEEKFSMFRLRLRGYPCLYESFMIILWYREHNCAPPAISSYWCMYVISRFLKEPWNRLKMFFEGKIQQCIDYMNQKHDLNVELFDCTRHKEECATLKNREEAGDDVPQYFIAYWAEHAFPICRSKLPDIMNHLDKMCEDKHLEQKMFCVIPPPVSHLYKEFHLKLLNPPFFLNYELLGIKNRTMLAIAGRNFKKLSHQTEQQQLMSAIAEYSQQSEREIIQERFSNIAEKDLEIIRRDEDKIKEEITNIIKDRRIITPTIPYQDLQDIKARRLAVFLKNLPFCIDIESAISNEAEGYGNHVPFILTGYGQLCRAVLEEDQAGKMCYKKHIDFYDSPVVFTGFDCVQQFVNWLFMKGYCWRDADYETLTTSTLQSRAQIFNVIFAHNGFGYDFRFLFADLHKLVTGFEMVGDANKMKLLQGNGLFFYDFANIFPGQKLDTIAKSLFPNDRDKWKIECSDVIDFPIEAARLALRDNTIQLQEMITYCGQDSRVLYHCVVIFFQKVYLEQFGHGFTKNIYFFSSSALAWEIFTTCFLKEPLLANPYTQQIEQSMKVGGFCMVYRHKAGFAVSIDVNSMYPAMMKNLMPLHYVKQGAQSVEDYEHKLTMQNYKSLTSPTSAYQIKFRFSEGVTVPTICIKNDQALNMVLQSESYDQDDSDVDKLWVWGDSIHTSFECVSDDFQCKVFKRIEFIPGDIHGEYVDCFYKKRQESKDVGDAVGDTLFKGLLNYLFGKYGQMQFKTCLFGSSPLIRDMIYRLSQCPDVHDMTCTQLITEEIPLYQLKYRRRGSELNHKGVLVRFASFIMATARNYLMRIKHAVIKEFGPDSIVYCDTDSVTISFDKIDPATNSLMKIHAKRLRQMRKDGAAEQDVLKEVAIAHRIMSNSTHIAKLLDMKIRDCTRLDRDEYINLIDAKRLGACKIEKFIFKGSYMGQKQYYSHYITSPNKVDMVDVKLRGIVKKEMKEEYISIMEKFLGEEGFGTEEKFPFFHVEATVWQKIGDGVLTSRKIKIGRPTLTKRMYNFEHKTSRPFGTMREFAQSRLAYNERMDHVKGIYKDQILDLSEEVKERIDSLMSSNVARLNAQNRMISEEVVAKMQENMKTARKEFMLQLPGIRFGQIQLQVARLVLEDGQILLNMEMFLPKVISIVEKALSVFQLDMTRTVYEERQYLNFGEDNITMQQQARILSFTLFSRYILSRIGKKHDNLTKVCQMISKIIRQYVDPDLCIFQIDRPQQMMVGWRTAIAWSLQFLSTPISIETEDQPAVTTLWYLLDKNYQLSIEEFIRAGMDVEVVDTTILQKEFGVQLLRDEDVQVDGVFSGNFDFVSELPKYQGIRTHQKLIQLARVEQKNGKTIEEEDIDMQGLQKYDDVLMTKVADPLIPEDKEKHMQKLFTKVFFTEDNNLHLNTTAEQKLLMNFALQDKARYSDANLARLFGARGDNQKMFTKQRVMDFIIIFQFLHFSGCQGIKVFRQVYSEWLTLSKQRDKTLAFVNSLRVVFQKQQLFEGIRSQDQLRKLCFKPIFKVFEDLLVNDTQSPLEEGYSVLHLQTKLADTKTCKRDVFALLEQSITDENQAAIGKQMVAKILKWGNPTPAMVGRLKSILFMTADVAMDSDRNLIGLMREHRAQIEEYLKMKKDQLDLVRQEDPFEQFVQHPGVRAKFDCTLSEVDVDQLVDEYENRVPVVQRYQSMIDEEDKMDFEFDIERFLQRNDQIGDANDSEASAEAHRRWANRMPTRVRGMFEIEAEEDSQSESANEYSMDFD